MIIVYNARDGEKRTLETLGKITISYQKENTHNMLLDKAISDLHNHKTIMPLIYFLLLESTYMQIQRFNYEYRAQQKGYLP